MNLLAERAVQLGGTAEGTIQVAAERPELQEYPLPISGEQDHVDALSSALAAYGKSARAREAASAVTPLTLALAT
jgi:starvation-inducible DNA-binding protein